MAQDQEGGDLKYQIGMQNDRPSHSQVSEARGYHPERPSGHRATPPAPLMPNALVERIHARMPAILHWKDHTGLRSREATEQPPVDLQKAWQPTFGATRVKLCPLSRTVGRCTGASVFAGRDKLRRAMASHASSFGRTPQPVRRGSFCYRAPMSPTGALHSLCEIAA